MKNDPRNEFVSKLIWKHIFWDFLKITVVYFACKWRYLALLALFSAYGSSLAFVDAFKRFLHKLTLFSAIGAI